MTHATDKDARIADLTTSLDIERKLHHDYAEANRANLAALIKTRRQLAVASGNSAFDEQSDGDPHGECVVEIHRLEGSLAASQARCAALEKVYHEVRDKLASTGEHGRIVAKLDRVLSTTPSDTSALDAVVEKANPPCVWTLTDDDEGIWTSTCGLVDWCFNEGGPAENKMAFCCGCGKPLEVRAAGLRDHKETL